MSARIALIGSWLGILFAPVALLATTGCGSGGGGNFNSSGLVHLLTTTVPQGTTGVAYSTAFVADFPHPPGRFLLTGGALPPGLSLDNQTGLLTGFPRQVGSFSFEIAARDGVDQTLPDGRDANFSEDRRDFTLVVVRGLPNILPQQLPSAQYRASYGYQIDIAGGTPPYTFTLVGGSLPAGVSVSTSGFVGNFPSSETPTGDPFEFDVKVVDATGQFDIEHLSLDVVILPLLILTGSPLQPGAENFVYDVTLQLASIGAGQPITWAQENDAWGPDGIPGNGDDPAVPSLVLHPGEIDITTIGLQVTGDGHVKGTPTMAGTFLFSVQVTDEANQRATRAYSLTINPGPVLISITPNKSVASPPFVFEGLNFQPNLQLIFKPGPQQSVVNPSPAVTTETTITLPAAPPAPGGGGGIVAVKVVNPDGGSYTLPNAFAFPAATLSFDTANPSFPSPQTSLSSTGIAVADINGDGFADFVHVGSDGTSGAWGNGTPNAGGVHVMYNLHSGPGGTYNGAFNRVILSSTNDFETCKLHDVDTDGDLDIVTMVRVGGDLRMRVWRNPGAPNFFTAATPFQDTSTSWQGSDSTFHVSDMALGNFTPGDATPDIAYTMQDFFSTQYVYTGYTWQTAGGSLSSVKGNGNGTFGEDIQQKNWNQDPILDGTGAAGLAAGDLDGDGQDDVVLGDEAAGVAATGLPPGQGFFQGGTAGLRGQIGFASQSDGLFGQWTPLTRGGAGCNETFGIAINDVNGDGTRDILIAAGFAGMGAVPSINVFQGNGSGFFTGVNATMPAGAAPTYRYLTTFDGNFDIPLDVAVTASQNRIDVFKGRAGTLGLQFSSPSILLLTGSPRFGRIAAGDFNADGREDLVVAMSFFQDQRVGGAYNPAPADRGNGSPTGAVIYLNTSN